MRESQEISGSDRRIKMRFTQREARPAPRPYFWWHEQARVLDGGTCPKCRGLTMGQYIPATRATESECAVIEKCRICGWERVVIKGRNGVPS
jgi:hypothetical protein